MCALRVLRSTATLSLDEHRQLANHFFAIKRHVQDIIQILNGRVKARWYHPLCRAANTTAGLNELRSSLEGDLYTEHPDQATTNVYYGGPNAGRQSSSASQR